MVEDVVLVEDKDVCMEEYEEEDDVVLDDVLLCGSRNSSASSTPSQFLIPDDFFVNPSMNGEVNI